MKLNSVRINTLVNVKIKHPNAYLVNNGTIAKIENMLHPIWVLVVIDINNQVSR